MPDHKSHLDRFHSLLQPGSLLSRYLPSVSSLRCPNTNQSRTDEQHRNASHFLLPGPMCCSGYPPLNYCGWPGIPFHLLLFQKSFPGKRQTAWRRCCPFHSDPICRDWPFEGQRKTFRSCRILPLSSCRLHPQSSDFLFPTALYSLDSDFLLSFRSAHKNIGFHLLL